MSVIERLNAALSGRYRVERELGEGGMAIVYLADDVRHNRKVALKVLKPELAAVVGSERFLTEIETTANLQHPHILPLFDSGEADGFLFFVMPYIEGETLREKIDREKQLPVDEAVGIATAVASALSVAHEQGVIHRDIKPANILLSRGEPLVTDFGVAIAVTKSSGARLTETGLSVGTPYYMSPEQATGDREITAASDVYALGCVLYEMLLGEPPHVGATAQAVLGKILTEKPRNPSAVRAVVPANVEGAVLQALEKLPADRFRSASGFVRAMTDTSFRYGTSATTGGAATAGSGRWKPAALGALGGLVFGGVLWSALVGRPERPSPVVLGLEMPEGATFVTDVAVSRDGSMFAISTREASGASPRIWIRRADEADFRPVAGAEGGHYPDFSPDGKWLVFRHDERDALLKVALSGGGALPILEVDSIIPFDPEWGDDGTIVFSTLDGLWRVSETGEGGPQLLSRSLRNLGAQVLPDGSGALAVGDGIYFIDFETDSATLLVPGARGPKILETGHLLYLAESGGLFVVPFDPSRHEVTGQPTPVLDGVAAFDARGYDVSSTGTLVYYQGQPAQRDLSQRRFVFLDREGRADTVPMTARFLLSPSISPNGRYIAYETYVGGDDESRQIQVLDLVTGSTPEVTSEGASLDPVWSPDGTRLAIAGERGSDVDFDVFVVSVDGQEAERRLFTRPGSQHPTTWSAQDEIVFTEGSNGFDYDLWIAPLAEGAQPRPYLAADYYEDDLQVSPDGALAAYESNETGTSEIFVRGFPDPVGKWNVSVGSGRRPRWSPDGEELYFWRTSGTRAGVDSLFVVPVQREPDFVPGPPTFLFTSSLGALSWDVHPDGRFLVIVDAAAPSATRGEPAREPRWLVVLNWFTELEERLGQGR